MGKSTEEKRRIHRSKVFAPLFLLLVAVAGFGVVGAVRWRHQWYDTHLLSAARAGDARRAEALLQQGADIEARYHDDTFPWREDEFTPLAFAASRGDLPLVKLLLARGANVNATTKSRDGFPGRDLILCTAAEKGRTEMVDLLLKAGANVDAHGGMSVTPLMLAARGEHLETAELLIKNGADRSARDERGFTASDFAKSKHRDVYAPMRHLFENAAK